MGARIAGYKRPRSVHVLADLPRNATGKVLKRARAHRPRPRRRVDDRTRSGSSRSSTTSRRRPRSSRRSPGPSTGASTWSWRRAPAATGGRTGWAPASRCTPTSRPTAGRMSAPPSATACRSCSRSGSPAATSTSTAACSVRRPLRGRGLGPARRRHPLRGLAAAAARCAGAAASRSSRVGGRGTAGRARRPMGRRRRRARGRADRAGADHGRAGRRRRRRGHRAGAGHRPVHGAADAARLPDGRRGVRRQALGVRRARAGAGRLGQAHLGELDETGLRGALPDPRYAVERALAGLAHVLRAVPPDAGGEPRRLPRPVRGTLRRDRRPGVRCTGARWIERPYTVLLEGARHEGFRAISMLGVREPCAAARRPGSGPTGRSRRCARRDGSPSAMAEGG